MAKKNGQQPAREPQPEHEAPNPKVKLVYIGPCTTSDEKLGGLFLPITSEQVKEKRLPEVLPPERVYGGKIPKLVGRPGTIYEFECKAESENTIFGNARRWVGFLENDPRVVQWQANHDAFFAAQELQRQEKKGKNTNLIQRQLAPLKVAYGRMVGHHRAVFLAQIISYITGRVTKADLQRAEEADTDEEND
jgi:hypothetical protein